MLCRSSKAAVLLLRWQHSSRAASTFRAVFLEKPTSGITPQYAVKSISTDDLEKNPNKNKEVGLC